VVFQEVHKLAASLTTEAALELQPLVYRMEVLLAMAPLEREVLGVASALLEKVPQGLDLTTC
jgi:hypothetical protein